MSQGFSRILTTPGGARAGILHSGYPVGNLGSFEKAITFFPGGLGGYVEGMSRSVSFLLGTRRPTGPSSLLSQSWTMAASLPQLGHAPGVGDLHENRVGHIREKSALKGGHFHES